MTRQALVLATFSALIGCTERSGSLEAPPRDDTIPAGEGGPVARYRANWQVGRSIRLASVVVAASTDSEEGKSGYFYVQDPGGQAGSSVLVYRHKLGQHPMPKRGDVVSLAGSMSEYGGTFQIEGAQWEVDTAHSPGPLAAPITVSASQIHKASGGIVAGTRVLLDGKVTVENRQPPELAVPGQSFYAGFEIAGPDGTPILVADRFRREMAANGCWNGNARRIELIGGIVDVIALPGGGTARVLNPAGCDEYQPKVYPEPEPQPIAAYFPNWEAGAPIKSAKVYVTATNHAAANKSGYFVVQDPAGEAVGGVQVFRRRGAAPEVLPNRGDAILITGTMDQHQGVRQIVDAQVEMVEANPNPPTPPAGFPAALELSLEVVRKDPADESPSAYFGQRVMLPGGFVVVNRQPPELLINSGGSSFYAGFEVAPATGSGPTVLVATKFDADLQAMRCMSRDDGGFLKLGGVFDRWSDQGPGAGKNVIYPAGCDEYEPDVPAVNAKPLETYLDAWTLGSALATTDLHVTASNNAAPDKSGYFYVQDAAAGATRGVMVFRKKNAAPAVLPKRGDVIQITWGKMDRYRGVKQIADASWTVVSENPAAPAPPAGFAEAAPLPVDAVQKVPPAEDVALTHLGGRILITTPMVVVNREPPELFVSTTNGGFYSGVEVAAEGTTGPTVLVSTLFGDDVAAGGCLLTAERLATLGGVLNDLGDAGPGAGKRVLYPAGCDEFR